jgi:3-hydroxyisobutyrate dehydrogenase-like beta-hydroxyacid dehydrogenase
MTTDKTSRRGVRSPTAPAATPASATAQRVGFLGLGIMGSAMAGNLMKAGFTVSGFDPSAAARQHFKAAGGMVCRDAATLARQVDVIITSLPSAAALLQSAEQVAGAAARGVLVVETSTLDVTDKEAARQVLAKAGVVLLDCPLSGTGAQAARKDLTVYASGPSAAIKRLQPVFEGFTKSQFNLGAFGNGMRMKLMANLLVAIHNVSTAEALLLGQRWGIRPSEAVKVLADGAGGSRMLQVRGPQMENRGWEAVTMKIEVWQKDMKLIGAALREMGVPAPLFAATVPIYDAAMGMGHARHDTAAVFDVLDRMSSGSVSAPARGRAVKAPGEKARPDKARKA